MRCDNIPEVMAAQRNTVIGLMRWRGETNIAALSVAALPPSPGQPRSPKDLQGGGSYDSTLWALVPSH